MQAKYDPDADALYLKLAEARIIESEEVKPGIVFDFDADGRVVGIEILDASKHVAAGADFARLTTARRPMVRGTLHPPVPSSKPPPEPTAIL